MKTDVRNWCRTCHHCQSSKVQRHVHAPLQPRTLPDRRFGSLHVDIVDPLPESESMTYLFTIGDRYTRWAEAIPMAGYSTETCIKGFLRHWIAHFGVPGSHFGQRPTVHLEIMDQTKQTSGNFGQQHYCLPTQGKWSGRKNAPAIESFPQGPFHRTQVDGWVANGFARNMNCLAWGCRMLPSWPCIWHRSRPSRRVIQCPKDIRPALRFPPWTSKFNALCSTSSSTIPWHSTSTHFRWPWERWFCLHFPWCSS